MQNIDELIETARFRGEIAHGVWKNNAVGDECLFWYNQLQKLKDELNKKRPMISSWYTVCYKIPDNEIIFKQEKILAVSSADAISLFFDKMKIPDVSVIEIYKIVYSYQ